MLHSHDDVGTNSRACSGGDQLVGESQCGERNMLKDPSPSYPQQADLRHVIREKSCTSSYESVTRYSDQTYSAQLLRPTAQSEVADFEECGLCKSPFTNCSCDIEDDRTEGWKFHDSKMTKEYEILGDSRTLNDVSCRNDPEVCNEWEGEPYGHHHTKAAHEFCGNNRKKFDDINMTSNQVDPLLDGRCQTTSNHPYWDPDFWIPRRPLARDRMYHFNVIYNHARSALAQTEDSSMALRVTTALVERLEMKGYVNSYYYDRDHRHENTLSDELERVLTGSSVTILLLTPGFIQNCLGSYLTMPVFRKLLSEPGPNHRLITLSVGVSSDQVPQQLRGCEILYFQQDWEVDLPTWNRFDTAIMRYLQEQRSSKPTQYNPSIWSSSDPTQFLFEDIMSLNGQNPIDVPELEIKKQDSNTRIVHHDVGPNMYTEVTSHHVPLNCSYDCIQTTYRQSIGHDFDDSHYQLKPQDLEYNGSGCTWIKLSQQNEMYDMPGANKAVDDEPSKGLYLGEAFVKQSADHHTCTRSEQFKTNVHYPSKCNVSAADSHLNTFCPSGAETQEWYDQNVEDYSTLSHCESSKYPLTSKYVRLPDDEHEDVAPTEPSTLTNEQSRMPDHNPAAQFHRNETSSVSVNQRLISSSNRLYDMLTSDELDNVSVLPRFEEDGQLHVARSRDDDRGLGYSYKHGQDLSWVTSENDAEFSKAPLFADTCNKFTPNICEISGFLHPEDVMDLPSAGEFLERYRLDVHDSKPLGFGVEDVETTEKTPGRWAKEELNDWTSSELIKSTVFDKPSNWLYDTVTSDELNNVCELPRFEDDGQLNVANSRDDGQELGYSYKQGQDLSWVTSDNDADFSKAPLSADTCNKFTPNICEISGFLRPEDVMDLPSAGEFLERYRLDVHDRKPLVFGVEDVESIVKTGKWAKEESNDWTSPDLMKSTEYVTVSNQLYDVVTTENTVSVLPRFEEVEQLNVANGNDEEKELGYSYKQGQDLSWVTSDKGGADTCNESNPNICEISGFLHPEDVMDLPSVGEFLERYRLDFHNRKPLAFGVENAERTEKTPERWAKEESNDWTSPNLMKSTVYDTAPDQLYEMLTSDELDNNVSEVQRFEDDGQSHVANGRDDDQELRYSHKHGQDLSWVTSENDAEFSKVLSSSDTSNKSTLNICEISGFLHPEDVMDLPSAGEFLERYRLDVHDSKPLGFGVEDVETTEKTPGRWAKEELNDWTSSELIKSTVFDKPSNWLYDTVTSDELNNVCELPRFGDDGQLNVTNSRDDGQELGYSYKQGQDLSWVTSDNDADFSKVPLSADTCNKFTPNICEISGFLHPEDVMDLPSAGEFLERYRLDVHDRKPLVFGVEDVESIVKTGKWAKEAENDWTSQELMKSSVYDTDHTEVHRQVAQDLNDKTVDQHMFDTSDQQVLLNVENISPFDDMSEKCIRGDSGKKWISYDLTDIGIIGDNGEEFTRHEMLMQRETVDKWTSSEHVYSDLHTDVSNRLGQSGDSEELSFEERLEKWANISVNSRTVYVDTDLQSVDTLEHMTPVPETHTGMCHMDTMSHQENLVDVEKSDLDLLRAWHDNQRTQSTREGKPCTEQSSDVVLLDYLSEMVQCINSIQSSENTQLDESNLQTDGKTEQSPDDEKEMERCSSSDKYQASSTRNCLSRELSGVIPNIESLDAYEDTASEDQQISLEIRHSLTQSDMRKTASKIQSSTEDTVESLSSFSTMQTASTENFPQAAEGMPVKTSADIVPAPILTTANSVLTIDAASSPISSDHTSRQCREVSPENYFRDGKLVIQPAVTNCEGQNSHYTGLAKPDEPGTQTYIAEHVKCLVEEGESKKSTDVVLDKPEVDKENRNPTSHQLIVNKDKESACESFETPSINLTNKVPTNNTSTETVSEPQISVTCMDNVGKKNDWTITSNGKHAAGAKKQFLDNTKTRFTSSETKHSMRENISKQSCHEYETLALDLPLQEIIDDFTPADSTSVMNVPTTRETIEHKQQEQHHGSVSVYDQPQGYDVDRLAEISMSRETDQKGDNLKIAHESNDAQQLSAGTSLQTDALSNIPSSQDSEATVCRLDTSGSAFTDLHVDTQMTNECSSNKLISLSNAVGHTDTCTEIIEIDCSSDTYENSNSRNRPSGEPSTANLEIESRDIPTDIAYVKQHISTDIRPSLSQTDMPQTAREIQPSTTHLSRGDAIETATSRSIVRITPEEQLPQATEERMSVKTNEDIPPTTTQATANSGSVLTTGVAKGLVSSGHPSYHSLKVSTDNGVRDDKVEVWSTVTRDHDYISQNSDQVKPDEPGIQMYIPEHVSSLIEIDGAEESNDVAAGKLEAGKENPTLYDSSINTGTERETVCELIEPQSVNSTNEVCMKSTSAESFSKTYMAITYTDNAGEENAWTTDGGKEVVEIQSVANTESQSKCSQITHSVGENIQEQSCREHEALALDGPLKEAPNHSKPADSTSVIEISTTKEKINTEQQGEHHESVSVNDQLPQGQDVDMLTGTSMSRETHQKGDNIKLSEGRNDTQEISATTSLSTDAVSNVSLDQNSNVTVSRLIMTAFTSVHVDSEMTNSKKCASTSLIISPSPPDVEPMEACSTSEGDLQDTSDVVIGRSAVPISNHCDAMVDKSALPANSFEEENKDDLSDATASAPSIQEDVIGRKDGLHQSPSSVQEEENTDMSRLSFPYASDSKEEGTKSGMTSSNNVHVLRETKIQEGGMGGVSDADMKQTVFGRPKLDNNVELHLGAAEDDAGVNAENIHPEYSGPHGLSERQCDVSNFRNPRFAFTSYLSQTESLQESGTVNIVSHGIASQMLSNELKQIDGVTTNIKADVFTLDFRVSDNKLLDTANSDRCEGGTNADKENNLYSPQSGTSCSETLKNSLHAPAFMQILRGEFQEQSPSENANIVASNIATEIIMRTNTEATSQQMLNESSTDERKGEINDTANDDVSSIQELRVIGVPNYQTNEDTEIQSRWATTPSITVWPPQNTTCNELDVQSCVKHCAVNFCETVSEAKNAESDALTNESVKKALNTSFATLDEGEDLAFFAGALTDSLPQIPCSDESSPLKDDIDSLQSPRDPNLADRGFADSSKSLANQLLYDGTGSEDLQCPRSQVYQEGDSGYFGEKLDSLPHSEGNQTTGRDPSTCSVGSQYPILSSTPNPPIMDWSPHPSKNSGNHEDASSNTRLQIESSSKAIFSSETHYHSVSQICPTEIRFSEYSVPVSACSNPVSLDPALSDGRCTETHQTLFSTRHDDEGESRSSARLQSSNFRFNISRDDCVSNEGLPSSRYLNTTRQESSSLRLATIDRPTRSQVGAQCSTVQDDDTSQEDTRWDVRHVTTRVVTAESESAGLESGSQEANETEPAVAGASAAEGTEPQENADWLLQIYKGVCHVLAKPDMPYMG